MIPRSASKSSTSRKLRVKRRHSQIACRTISGGKQQPSYQIFCIGLGLTRCRFTLIAETDRVSHFRALPETGISGGHLSSGDGLGEV